jgi:hypothetical protein
MVLSLCVVRAGAKPAEKSNLLSLLLSFDHLLSAATRKNYRPPTGRGACVEEGIPSSTTIFLSSWDTPQCRP